jgi:hypothetical protein
VLAVGDPNLPGPRHVLACLSHGAGERYLAIKARDGGIAALDRAAVRSHPGGPEAGRRISGPLGTALVGAVAAATALAEAVKRELQPFADRLASIEQRLSAPPAGSRDR